MNAIVGRLCMLAGLIILPIGFSYGMFHDNIQMEVRLLGVGGAVFVIGWLIAKKGR